MSVKNVIRLECEIPSITAPQNICAFMFEQFRSDPGTFTVDPDDLSLSIGGRISLPSLQADAPEYFGQTYFVRFLAEDQQLDRFHLGYAAGVKTDRMDAASASAYIHTGVVSVRAVTDGIRGNYEVGRPLAELLAASFTSSLNRYDVSMICSIGHIMEQQLADIHALGVVPIFGAAIANDVVYVAMNPDANGLPAAHLILKNGISSGAIFIDARQFGDNDLRVLRMLSIGPSGITTLNHVMWFLHLRLYAL